MGVTIQRGFAHVRKERGKGKRNSVTGKKSFGKDPEVTNTPVSF